MRLEKKARSTKLLFYINSVPYVLDTTHKVFFQIPVASYAQSDKILNDIVKSAKYKLISVTF